ncbi:MAG: N-acetyl-alpha-D-glucosaminyl L-malate synthase BshA [Saprospiraceae bacterium]|nr:N-acetyl-alpha-D-glucosaminyl L-malate synthase BshA [Saprospiraceae bacterium]
MKIGIVCYPTFGGSGVVATELGISMARRGHDIHFITYKQPARLQTYDAHIYFHEVSNFDYPLFEHSTYDLALASTLVNIVKYEELDLLHVHYAIPHAAVAYLAKMILRDQGIDIPFITTLHGTDITLVGQDRSFAPVVEFSINHSDGVTAVSQFLKEETLSIFNIKNDIKVIHNFIDPKKFSKVDKEHFKKAIAPDGERILMHISNFRKVKRVQDVIKVFKKVNDVMPSKLILIGDGPERLPMESLSRELDIGNDVRFLGKQEAVEEILAVADLFLLPSAHESFGLAALEAMACEVPVISSNTGGLPELNKHGFSGFMADVGNIDAMTKYALTILESDEALETFRRQAYKQAMKFNIEKIVKEYEEYYESLLVHN